MTQQQYFSQLISTLQLVRIQCVETISRRLGDPLPEKDVEYNIEQLLGEKNPEPLGASHILFRVKFDVVMRNKDLADFVQMSISFGVMFELKDKQQFDSLWSQAQLKSVFENEQLKKTLWPYVRQFVSESLVRLELTNITLPWLI